MSDRLNTGEKMLVWDSIISIDSRYHLVLQSDGNLVLYDEPTHIAVWATNTVGQDVDHAIMQADGNFVMYRNDGSVVWAYPDRAEALASFVLTVLSDGDVIIYRESPPSATGWSFTRGPVFI